VEFHFNLPVNGHYHEDTTDFSRVEFHFNLCIRGPVRLK
jgi:hypothetical protein